MRKYTRSKKQRLKRRSNMGLLGSSSKSFVVFDILLEDGGLESTALAKFLEDNIRAFSFVGIDDTYDEYSIGWVSLLDPFDPAFLTGAPTIGDYVTATLRVDQRKVATAQLNRLCALEERKYMQDNQVAKVRRSQKLEIKQRIRTELMMKAIPTTTTVDVVVRLDNSSVLFFSTNKAMQSLFEDFFRECFGLTVQQQVPFTIAQNGVASSYLAAIEALTPSILV
jgi:hypothetical protein